MTAVDSATGALMGLSGGRRVGAGQARWQLTGSNCEPPGTVARQRETWAETALSDQA